ncbi:MAG TPA: class I SAM-dependent methyltransferase, partial [Armatimonadota bacterium]|nr:class I SAM-dependent methyltransferase [Armatimonadota bacterium]
MFGPALALARKAARLNKRAAWRAEHDAEVVATALTARLQALCGASLGEARVLDFGCGYTYPLLVLLRERVGEIVGLEVAPVYRDGALAAVRASGALRRPGRSAEALLAYAQARRYYRHLERLTGRTIRHAEYQIVRYKGYELPFPPASFDGVVSNAVLQELPGELSHYARRIARLLRPGGWIDLEWHNFYSWSGHYLGEEESRRRPWGHLLEGRFNPDLNRATP